MWLDVGSTRERRERVGSESWIPSRYSRILLADRPEELRIPLFAPWDRSRLISQPVTKVAKLRHRAPADCLE